MKRFLTPAATFTPSAGTLDLSSIPSFDIRRLGAVIDLKTGGLVYAPVAGSGASAVSNGVLTLQAAMTGLSASDPLLVMYDDSTGKAAEDTTVQAVTAAINALAADVVNNHADFQALHTDLSTTLHADLQAVVTKLGAAPAQDATLAQAVTVLSNILTALGLLETDTTAQATITKLEAMRVLLAGTLRVDGSAVTQPVSATALPLPAGAATETTLATIKAILAAQASIAESTWYDPTVTPNLFYFRRVTNTDGVVTEVWTDPTGATVAFNANWKPLSSASSYQVLPAVNYDVKTAFTGASVDDVVVRVIILNNGVTPPTIAASLWLNANTGAVLSSVTMANMKEATRDISIPDGSFVTFGAMADAAAANPTAGGSFMSTFRGYWTNWLARVPVLGTAMMAGSTPMTLATDDKAAVAIGGAADAAATADTGTFSLVALAKRSLARWTTLIGVLPASLGQKTAALSFPVVIASDTPVAQDGTDMTMPSGVTAPSTGSGIRGWLSASWVQLLALATGLGAQADTAATSSTGSFSVFAWIKRFSANDDTALAAITAANTREGALPTALPDAFPTGASGKLGALGFIWAYAKAGATTLATLLGLFNAKSATGTLGAANASASLSGGPYGAVGFKLVGTSVQTISAYGTRDGTTYDVPLSLITEVAGGGSTSGQSLALNGAGPFFGYVEMAGCLGVALVTTAYTSGSLAATLTGTPTPRSVRVRAPVTDPIATRSSAGLGALTQVPTATGVGTDLRNTVAMPTNATGVLFSIPPGGEIDVAVMAAQPGATPFSIPYPNGSGFTLDIEIPLNGVLPFVTKNQPGTVNGASAPCGFRWT